MVEDRSREFSGSDEEMSDPPLAQRRRGSGIIFLLVAIALILAVGFFYLTKDREDNQPNVVTQAESDDSAARVVGNAAKDAANSLRNQN